LKKYIASGVKFALSLGIGIGVIWWFVGQMSDADKAHIVEDIKRANYFWVAVPPLFGLASNFFRTQRWRLLLRPLGYNPGFWNTFHSVMLMYLFNLIFPRLGEVSRCGVLARYEKVPLDKGIGTMVIERLMDVICLGIVMLILVVFEHDRFYQLYDMIVTNSSTVFGKDIAKYQINPAVKNGVMLAVLLAIIAFVVYQARKRGWGNIIANIKERAIGLFRGVISIKDIGSPWEFLFHTIMIWVCYYLMAYTAFMIFPETQGLSFLTGGVSLFFGGVAFAITPGGLGLAPIFTRTVLVLYGVASNTAFSVGLISWSVQTMSVIVIGVVSLALLAVLNKEQEAAAAVNA
jgi:glycosyltransferase 2 family protein